VIVSPHLTWLAVASPPGTASITATAKAKNILPDGLTPKRKECPELISPGRRYVRVHPTSRGQNRTIREFSCVHRGEDEWLTLTGPEPDLIDQLMHWGSSSGPLEGRR
jgi:hypothetical protein